MNLSWCCCFLIERSKPLKYKLSRLDFGVYHIDICLVKIHGVGATCVGECCAGKVLVPK